QLWDQAENALAQIVTFTPAQGSANVCLVTIQVQDGRGVAIARPFELMVYLSDSAVGDGLTATTASGTVGAGASGTDLQAKVAKKAIDVLTSAAGTYVLSIADNAKSPFVVCALCSGTGNLWVSAPLTTGQYG